MLKSKLQEELILTLFQQWIKCFTKLNIEFVSRVVAKLRVEPGSHLCRAVIGTTDGSRPQIQTYTCITLIL